MELTRSEIIPAPDDSTRVRLVGEVAFDGEPARDQIFIDVPGDLAPSLSTSGNPWLAALLIMAAHRGEPLRLPLPVDRRLYVGAYELLRLWHNWGWTPRQLIPIEVDVYESHAAGPPADRAMLFFGGGIDSMFSLFSDTPDLHPERPRPIDDLVSIWGFDIPLDTPAVYADLLDRHRRVAEATGRRLVDIRTNLRDVITRVDWGRSHGAALVALALALESRWGQVFIASDTHYAGLVPRGLHPMKMPLWSTGRQQVMLDGSGFTRQQKTAYVAGFSVAYDTLRVCSDPTYGGNCSRCGKCLRTMLMLDAIGALDRFTAFDSDGYIDRIPTSKRRGFHPFYLPEMRAEAIRQNRPDLLRAINRLALHWNIPTRRQRIEGWLSRWVLPGWFAARVGDLGDHVYMRYRRARGLASDKPRSSR